MREIKFRAWIKDYALMADVNFLNIDYKEIVVMIDENDYEFNCGEYELMQYTGLTDKNGREIYEFDYVRGVHRNFEWGNVVEVTFLNGCFMFGNYNAHEFFNKHQSIEIVGNLYENPELLEEMK